MAYTRIPIPLPPEGFPVPVDAITSSFRLFGLLPGYSKNDLGSCLVLFPAQWTIKILTTQHYAYSDILQVDFKPESFWRREQVMLKVAEESTCYYIKPSSAAITRDFLGFCHKRGLTLTPAAQQVASVS
ncbi:hypothetical protein MTX78_02055 [Hymenobacter tibetensis]|uniref:Uncharacterized protein n=1 Tax=Hymenobacter tibetensis TaxID=497967 RepID=A0ABY4CZA1_9BACT|nr:hypothetical protein [Hymenobacter tibetensis]UOG75391.1 hypothetical protein MTX78_02055 [Hymenobacter tibetensis]